VNRLLLPFLLEDGTLEAWHSGDEPLDRATLKPFLHAGTERQARSRAGRVLTRLILATAGARRLKDRAEQDWCPRRLRRLAASGDGYGVYLNRHEGVALEEIEAARCDGRVRRSRRTVDEVPDRLFRTLVPSASDSLIVVDPALVVRIETVSDRRIGGTTPACALPREDEK
jgi:hypothetical protein